MILNNEILNKDAGHYTVLIFDSVIDIVEANLDTLDVDQEETIKHTEVMLSIENLIFTIDIRNFKRSFQNKYRFDGELLQYSNRKNEAHKYDVGEIYISEVWDDNKDVEDFIKLDIVELVNKKLMDVNTI